MLLRIRKQPFHCVVQTATHAIFTYAIDNKMKYITIGMTSFRTQSLTFSEVHS